jgi:hypothetical protein
LWLMLELICFKAHNRGSMQKQIPERIP